MKRRKLCFVGKFHSLTICHCSENSRLNGGLFGKQRLAAEQLKPLDGLYEVKKWIEDRGLKRAAVTNAPRPNAELMISRLGLSNFFDAVIIGDECEHAKPHPEPYLKALEILKASKDHTFIFEVSFLHVPQTISRLKSYESFD